ncbi:MAG TPA: hypothetical protein VD999_02045 [Vitreimonas sp.]|nr:hypothetical protein [Vitreimonas sp.]
MSTSTSSRGLISFQQVRLVVLILILVLLLGLCAFLWKMYTTPAQVRMLRGNDLAHSNPTETQPTIDSFIKQPEGSQPAPGELNSLLAAPSAAPTTTNPPSPTTAAPSAKPIVTPLAKGPQTYFVRSGNTVGPQILQVDISEFDPAPNTMQSFTVKLRNLSPQPITKVSIELSTDNGTKTYPLSLSEGSAEAGIWKGSWSTTDTHNRIYTAKVVAADGNNSGSVVLTFR